MGSDRLTCEAGSIVSCWLISPADFIRNLWTVVHGSSRENVRLRNTPSWHLVIVPVVGILIRWGLDLGDRGWAQDSGGLSRSGLSEEASAKSTEGGTEGMT